MSDERFDVRTTRGDIVRIVQAGSAPILATILSGEDPTSATYVKLREGRLDTSPGTSCGTEPSPASA